MKNFNLLFSGQLYVVILSLGLISCHSGSSSNSQKQAVVFINEVKQIELFDSLNFPARVNAKINTTVLSESDGIVAQLLTALGRTVRVREKLMVLTHTDPIYQYAPVQILAPISGVVSMVDISIGSHVVQGQKLLSIIDPSQLKIHLELPAQDFDSVKKGSHGEFQMMNQETHIPVEVDGISPLVDPATGTASVEMSVLTHPGSSPSSFQHLSAGIQGQVIFKVNHHLGISIPVSSLFYKGSTPYVSIVDQEKIRQIQVTLGKKQRGYVEILSGLTAGMNLVERTSRFVADGDSVKVENSNTENLKAPHQD